jgi:hypothetical protein
MVAGKGRRPAVTIKPALGKSYSDVLREIKAKIKPEDIGAEIKDIRQTRNDKVLLEVGRGSAIGELALPQAVGEHGKVKTLTSMRSIEVRYLDCLIEKVDVGANERTGRYRRN